MAASRQAAGGSDAYRRRCHAAGPERRWRPAQNPPALMAAQCSGLARLLSSLLYEGLVIFGIPSGRLPFSQIVLTAFGLGAQGSCLWVHVFLLLMFYFIWFWLHGGQTLAMRPGSCASSMPTARRFACSRPRCAMWRPAVACLGIGILWALVDREHQYLHDRIAGTRIVFEPAERPAVLIRAVSAARPTRSCPSPPRGTWRRAPRRWRRGPGTDNAEAGEQAVEHVEDDADS